MTRVKHAVDILLLACLGCGLAQLFRGTTLRDLEAQLSVQATLYHKHYIQPLWPAKED